MATKPPRIALLIDAENTPPSCLPRVLAELQSAGVVTVRRAYGAWQARHLRGWRAAADRHDVDRIGQDRLVRGKNASDIALVIDAMTLLHAGTVDVLAIVSSDSDFAPLAVRARERGVTVLGFGEAKTPLHTCPRALPSRGSICRRRLPEPEPLDPPAPSSDATSAWSVP